MKELAARTIFNLFPLTEITEFTGLTVAGLLKLFTSKILLLFKTVTFALAANFEAPFISIILHYITRHHIDFRTLMLRKKFICILKSFDYSIGRFCEINSVMLIVFYTVLENAL